MICQTVKALANCHSVAHKLSISRRGVGRCWRNLPLRTAREQRPIIIVMFVFGTFYA